MILVLWQGSGLVAESMVRKRTPDRHDITQWMLNLTAAIMGTMNLTAAIMRTMNLTAAIMRTISRWSFECVSKNEHPAFVYR
jgi:hypothetical protein